MNTKTAKGRNTDLMEGVEEEILIPGHPSTKTSNIAHCANCTTKFKRHKRHMRYCSPQCKSEFNAREATRGATLYRAMQHARIAEKVEGLSGNDNPYLRYAFGLLDEWSADDMANGRAPSVPPTHALTSETD